MPSHGEDGAAVHQIQKDSALLGLRLASRKPEEAPLAQVHHVSVAVGWPGWSVLDLLVCFWFLLVPC